MTSALTQLVSGLGEVPHSTAEPVLARYASDESQLGAFPPEVVVWARQTADVQLVFQLANRHGVPVTPVGARTGKSGGSLPVHGGVALSLERLVAAVEIDAPNLTATVLPGVLLKAVDDAAAQHGLFYPPDPNSWESCTVGGTIAENAGGPSALKYGVTSDYVLGLEWVLPTGERLDVGRRTSKGVAGYDVVRLLVGSEGTLGVCTRATLKLIPRPRVVKTALVCFSNVADAAQAITQALQKGAWPRTLELLDDVALQAVDGQGLPVEKGAGAVVIAELDGNHEAAVLEELVSLANLFTEHRALSTVVAADESQRQHLWSVRRRVSPALKVLGGHKLSEDIVVPRARVPQAIEQFKALGRQHGLVVATYGHAGDGNLHTNVLFGDGSDRPRVDALLADLMRATIALGGTITGEHGVGFAKKQFLPIEQSALLIELQQKLRGLFDPRGLCNPGKLWPDE